MNRMAGQGMEAERTLTRRLVAISSSEEDMDVEEDPSEESEWEEEPALSTRSGRAAGSKPEGEQKSPVRSGLWWYLSQLVGVGHNFFFFHNGFSFSFLDIRIFADFGDTLGPIYCCSPTPFHLLNSLLVLNDLEQVGRLFRASLDCVWKLTLVLGC